MKSRRITAAVTALILAGVGVFAGSAAANADDFYLTAGDLTAKEGSSYPAGWFQGGGTVGTIASGTSGLTVTGGKFQLLNGTPGDVSGGLAALGTTAGLVLSGGDASFQIPIYAGAGSTSFTTLRAESSGSVDGKWSSEYRWTTSQNINAATTAGVGFEANTTHTLAEYQAAFISAPTILAFGFNTAPVTPATTTVAALSWNGDTYFFLPRSTIALNPTSLTPEALATTGVAVTASGFIPGESVDLFWSTGESGEAFDTVVADASGAVAGTLISDLGVGSYTVGALGADSGARAETTLTVAAAAPVAAAPAAPALAETGTDTLVPIIGAGILLLAGAIALIFAARRRQTTV